MSYCMNCKKPIGDQERVYMIENNNAVLCVNCGDKQIDVYKYQPDGLNSCCENDPNVVMDLLKEADAEQVIHITKSRMKQADYYNLPEFTGF